MAIRLGSNQFVYKESPLKSEDLNDTFSFMSGKMYLDFLKLASKNSLTVITSKNFTGDAYIDENGYLNKINTTNTTAVHEKTEPFYTNVKTISNPTQVSTGSTSYVVVKTITPTFKVRKVIGYAWPSFDDTVYVKIRFTDAEGFWESSEVSSHYYGINYSLNNPQPDKTLTKVEVLLRIAGEGTLTAYEKDTLLYALSEFEDKMVQTITNSIDSGFTHFAIVADEETTGTGSVTYDISFDGGTNYQTGLISYRGYEITNPGTSLILKQNLNAGSDNGLAKTYNYGVVLW